MRARCALGDGLRSVQEEVEDDLAEPRLVAEHGGDGRGSRTSSARSRISLPAMLRAESITAPTSTGTRRSSPAREKIRRSRTIADALTAFLRVRERVPAERKVLGALGAQLRELLLHQVEVRHDVRERVVDLVRDSGRERADGRQPIGLREARLERLALGDVAPHREDRGAALVVDRDRRELGGDRLAVLLAQAQLAHGEALAVVQHPRDTLAVRLDLVGIQDALDPQREHLLA